LGKMIYYNNGKERDKYNSLNSFLFVY